MILYSLPINMGHSPVCSSNWYFIVYKKESVYFILDIIDNIFFLKSIKFDVLLQFHIFDAIKMYYKSTEAEQPAFLNIIFYLDKFSLGNLWMHTSYETKFFSDCPCSTTYAAFISCTKTFKLYSSLRTIFNKTPRKRIYCTLYIPYPGDVACRGSEYTPSLTKWGTPHPTQPGRSFR